MKFGFHHHASRVHASAGESLEPTLLRYSYYTAGSGGAGPTILETSFLLAGEPVVVYKEGKRYELPPISNRREVDFGTGGCLAALRCQTRHCLPGRYGNHG